MCRNFPDGIKRLDSVGRGNSTCKGPEVGACTASVRGNEDASEGGEGWGRKSAG